MRVVFDVHVAEEGGYWAEAQGHFIVAQGDSLPELKRNMLEAAQLHFEGEAKVESVRYVLHHEETIVA